MGEIDFHWRFGSILENHLNQTKSHNFNNQETTYNLHAVTQELTDLEEQNRKLGAQVLELEQQKDEVDKSGPSPYKFLDLSLEGYSKGHSAVGRDTQ